MRNGFRGGIVAAGVVVAGALGAVPAAADTVNFPYVAPTESKPSPYAEWTVPTGVTQATFDLYGAQGAGTFQMPGGKGAHTTTTLAVSAGEVYRVYVGGQGAAANAIAAGGYNGGGSARDPRYEGLVFGGGGATDLRQGPSYGVGARVLVAAGGGGTSENADAVPGDSGADGGTGTTGVGPYKGEGGRSGTAGGAGGAGAAIYECDNGSNGTETAGGDGAPSKPACLAGGGGGGGLLGGGGGGGGLDGSGAGGGGSSKPGTGTLVDGDHTGDGQASVTYTAPAPPPSLCVRVDGPLWPFLWDGSSRFKAGTVLEVRVKASRGSRLITDLKPQVNIVRTGAPSGSQRPNVAVLKRSGDSGSTARYSAQFGQYVFYASTVKSQFNGGKDLAPGRYRVDVSDPVFPGSAHKVTRSFAIVP